MSRYLPDPPEGYDWFALEVGVDGDSVSKVSLMLCLAREDKKYTYTSGIVRTVIQDFGQLSGAAKRLLAELRRVEDRLDNVRKILKEVNQ